MSALRLDKNVTILVVLAGIALVVWGVLANHLQPAPCWLLLLAVLILFLGAVGIALAGRWDGVLIDDRNKISLSRLQMVLWTLLIFSALLAVALLNLRVDDPHALAVSLPSALWMAMGISAASFAGTPLILSGKAQQDTNALQLKQTTTALTAAGNTSVTNSGKLLRNNSKADAQFADIFRGDEVGNGASVDLGKVQMFFLTLILILAYGLAIGKQLLAFKVPGLHAFPPLDQSMIALLGISHAGYLAYKAAPHTVTADSTSAARSAGIGAATANGAALQRTAVTGVPAVVSTALDSTLPPLNLKEVIANVHTQPYPDSPGEDMSQER